MLIDIAAEFPPTRHGWSRPADDEGERTRPPLTDILDRMFYALDDYAIDPSLHEPGDLTDDQLADIARGELASA